MSSDFFEAARWIPTGFFRKRGFMLAASLSLVTLIACVAIGWRFKLDLESRMLREARNVAILLVAEFDYTIARIDGYFDKVGRDFADLYRADAISNAEFEKYLSPRPPLISILISHDRGTVPEDVPPQLRAIVGQAAAGRRMWVGQPFRLNETQSFVLPISKKIVKHENDVGTVVGLYDLTDFTSLFARLDIKDLGMVALSGLDGVARLRSRNGMLSYGERIPPSGGVFQRLAAGEREGHFDAVSELDQVRRIGYFVSSETTPMFVYVGYSYSQLKIQTYKIYLLIALAWAVWSAAALVAIMSAEKAEEIHQRAENRALAAIANERQRILADMHDSIGSNLAVLIAEIDPRAQDLRGRVVSILTDLRLLIDTLATDQTSLPETLTSVIHRMRRAFESTQINLHVGEDVPSFKLTPRDSLSLKLLLSEALSNVLHHSRARNVWISAGEICAEKVVIRVEDDGHGFSSDQVEQGFGLRGMHNRALKMSRMCALKIQSRPCGGTQLEIHLGPIKESACGV